VTAAEALTVGNIDHIAFAVPDADAAAGVYEQSLGWRRIDDFELSGTAAATVASMFGLARLDRMRAVLLGSGEHHQGILEFIELTVAPTAGEPTPDLPSGFVCTSYRVHDVHAVFESLVGDGLEATCRPTPIDIGRRQVLIAALRGPHPGIIELVGPA
jgi:catechol 2,3-dioxygenase-like lactoylglutathione lyase family enzyme